MAKKIKSSFSGIDVFLKETFGERLSQTKLAKLIGEQQGHYSTLLKSMDGLLAKTLYKYVKRIYELGKIEGRRQNAENFFKAIETIHGIDNSIISKEMIAGKSDNSKSTLLSNYRNGKVPIPQKQCRKLLGKHSSRIFNPIIEFMECNPYKKGETWKLFKDDEITEKNIKDKLSNEENAKVGVYAMYDSSGRILYFGKTNNGLYTEIVQRLDAAVHRDVSLVYDNKFNHVGNPGKNDKKGSIRVGQMTRYFSAIEVRVSEAFVLRLIPNDDVNYKIENYK